MIYVNAAARGLWLTPVCWHLGGGTGTNHAIIGIGRADQTRSTISGARSEAIPVCLGSLGGDVGHLLRIHLHHRLHAGSSPGPDRRRCHHGRNPGRLVRDRFGFRAHRHLCAAGQFRLRRDHAADHREGKMMLRLLTGSVAASLFALGTSAAGAAGAIEGGGRQGLNVPAIAMFFIFVAATLGITYWAARRTRSAADFYAAGGGITGFQNGLAIAGDYMSAASFLGISGLVFASGFDGLIYSVGWLVGWPVILFLIAERLRNLGKYTFADVASFRLDQMPVRTLSAVGTLTVVAFYLIAQMVGAGKLIELLFGLPYLY